MDKKGTDNSRVIPDPGSLEFQHVLLDPPNWVEHTNSDISMFAEAISTLLGFGIFGQPISAELVRYRESANAVMRERIVRGE